MLAISPDNTSRKQEAPGQEQSKFEKICTIPAKSKEQQNQCWSHD